MLGEEVVRADSLAARFELLDVSVGSDSIVIGDAEKIGEEIESARKVKAIMGAQPRGNIA